AAEQAWGEQQALIRKARGIAEDARTYENDTGVHVLHIGFPLLSMPPGSMGAKLTRRVIAPIAFISVALTVKAGAAQSITLECRNEGADLVMPNTALLAWLEQQTGQPALEIDGDEEGTNPWQEIGEVVRRCAKLLELTPPEMFGGAEVDPANLRLQPAPRGDEGEGRPAILMSAVVGLFPTTNQGLLRDTQAMIAEPAVAGPIESFVKLDTSADKSAAATPTAGEEVVDKRKRVFAEDRLVSAADPCQCRAVKLARTSKNLVIHGPPGTGKSQTITNIIGDHLARGQRALLVCDKRTALDVVLNRLQSMGLDNLCAVVHDPQRDQRELYKSIREQLDALPEAQTDAGAEKKLAKADAELQKIHDELTKHTQALGARQGGPGGVGKSFHDLVGEWLALPAGEAKLDDGALVAVTMEELEGRSQELAEIFERAAGVDYRHNPWVEAAGMELEAFLATPMERFRGALAECQEKAKQADAAIDPAIPPFDPTLEIRMEGEERAALAEKLQPALQKLDSALVARWAKSDLAKIEQSLRKVNDASAFVQLLARGPLDGELALLARMSPPPVQAIGGQVAALDAFIAIVNKWYHFIKFKEKKEAQKVLGLYNLPISAGTAQRLRTFLIGLRARLVLSNVITQLGHPDNDPLLADEVIEASLRDHRQLLDLLRQVHATPALQPLAAAVTGAMTDPAAAAELLRGLRKSPARAKAIAALQDALGRSRLLDQAWLEKLEIELCQQKPAGAGIEKLAGSLDTLEAVLRVGKGLGDLPAGLRAGAQQLVDQDAAAEDAMRALEKAVIGQEIGRRLKSEPTLQALDGQRLKASFDRYRALEEQRRGLSRQVVAHNWVTRQKERLLASTGSRLNGQGAELRRRLAIRGERAMRLRQVIAAGMRGAG
ncbi:MAG TPA: AAA domain-containing protein, partial [Tepidisphaeraceae bacterium]